jgi:hypothetical protein
MKNISTKFNLRIGVDGMFATTINCVNSVEWIYTWDFFTGNRRNEFSFDVRKEIEDKLKKNK